MIVEANFVWIDEFLPRVLSFDFTSALHLCVNTCKLLFVDIRYLVLSLVVNVCKYLFIYVRVGCYRFQLLQDLVGSIQ